jgi:hypothetical protein
MHLQQQREQSETKQPVSVKHERKDSRKGESAKKGQKARRRDGRKGARENVLGDPGQTPDLLLLQLDEAEEDPILKLLQERLLVQLDIIPKEPILQTQSPLASIALTSHPIPTSSLLEERLVLHHPITNRLDLIHIVRPRQHVVSFGVQAPDGREETGAAFFGEVGVEGVKGDVDGSTVGFKGEEFGHDLGGRGGQGLDEAMEVFEVGFVEGVSDDFDVEVVEVGGREAVAEVGS